MGDLHRYVLVVLLLVGHPGFGQGDVRMRIERADRLFDRMAYAEARSAYEQVYLRGARSQHVVDRLAACCSLLGDGIAAERWSGEALHFLYPSADDHRRYIDRLVRNDHRAEAEEARVHALAQGRSDKELELGSMGPCADRLRAMTSRFEVRNAGINTAGPDLAPAWVGNGRVLFASCDERSGPVRTIDGWSGLPPFDLYIADRRGDDLLMERRPLAGNINGRFHEAGVSCDVRTQDLVLTRTSPPGPDGVRGLRLERAVHRGDRWMRASPLWPDDPYQSFHPALSIDGRTLYFASDRPGGRGGTDIHVSHWEHGAWSTPVALGPQVNTAGNELFPFVDEQGALFFSSDGHTGLGGLDVFKCAHDGADGFAEAVNLGAPLNGPSDETGFIIDRSGRHGYFASDRPGGMGGEDIYTFFLKGAIEPVPYACAGTVTDLFTERQQLGLPVQLLDEQGTMLASTSTDASGRFSFDIERGRSYRIRVARIDGARDEQVVWPNDVGDQRVIRRDLVLVPPKEVHIVGRCRMGREQRAAAGAKVTLVSMGGLDIQHAFTGAGGEFRFRAQANEPYMVYAELEGHFSVSFELTTGGIGSGPVFLDEKGTLVFEPMRTGVPIAFEELRFDEEGPLRIIGGAAELDQLATRLVLNPAIRVEISARAGDAAGALEREALESRLALVVEALRSRGVPGERITARVQHMRSDEPPNPEERAVMAYVMHVPSALD